MITALCGLSYYMIRRCLGLAGTLGAQGRLRRNDFYVSKPCPMGLFNLVNQGLCSGVNGGPCRDIIDFLDRLASC